MPSLAPDFLTALGMTGLAAWVLAWVIWVLGRPFWHQGLSQGVWSNLQIGLAYLLLALVSRSTSVPLLVAAQMLVCLATSSFIVGLQRFRQSDRMVRDSLTLFLPQVTTMTLAAVLLPQDWSRFHRLQACVLLAQMLYMLWLLLRIRRNTPGMGWVLIVVAMLVQALALVPLIVLGAAPVPFATHQLSPYEQLALWGVCLTLFVNLVVSTIGLLLMLRDRQSALDQDQARLDPLTQLPNRSALVQGLLEAMAHAVQHGTPLSVMVLDIDFFKRINDSHGHLVGDRVIQSVAHTLQSQLRKGDLAARYGGEEFVLLLPHTHATEALPLAQRLCDAVRQSPLQLVNGLRVEFTISVGVYTAQLQQSGPWEALVAAADAAMYEAKRNGRNQVVLAQAAPESQRLFQRDHRDAPF